MQFTAANKQYDGTPAATEAATGAVFEAARLAVTLRRTRAGHLDRLREAVPADVPMLFVPYLFTRGHGLRTTAQTWASIPGHSFLARPHPVPNNGGVGIDSGF